MATTIKVKNLPTGYQTIISNGKHSLIGDEPVSSKGTDLGFSPPVTQSEKTDWLNNKIIKI